MRSSGIERLLNTPEAGRSSRSNGSRGTSEFSRTLDGARTTGQEQAAANRKSQDGTPAVRQNDGAGSTTKQAKPSPYRTPFYGAWEPWEAGTANATAPSSTPEPAKTPQENPNNANLAFDPVTHRLYTFPETVAMEPIPPPKIISMEFVPTPEVAHLGILGQEIYTNELGGKSVATRYDLSLYRRHYPSTV